MQKENIILRAAEFFDMPKDGPGGLVHIELAGDREVFVENHKGIVELTENEVVLSAGKQSVKVIGHKLSVVAMNASEIRLAGRIESVSFGVGG